MDDRNVAIFRESVQLFARTQALCVERDAMLEANRVERENERLPVHTGEDFYRLSQSIEQAVSDHSFC